MVAVREVEAAGVFRGEEVFLGIGGGGDPAVTGLAEVLDADEGDVGEIGGAGGGELDGFEGAGAIGEEGEFGEGGFGAVVEEGDDGAG